MKIFAIHIDKLSRKYVLAKAREFMISEKFHHIATVNPEFLLESRKNGRFRNVLKRCDMRVSDGFGITLAYWFRGKRAPERYPGVDLMLGILNTANEKNLSVFLACRKDGLSSYEEIRHVILERFPHVKIFGLSVDMHKTMNNEQRTQSFCSLFLCNFGAPDQEFFLASLRKRDVHGLAMGVGGAFDYLTGKQKRAPIALRKMGLEWMWRLAMQPSGAVPRGRPRRWKRILRAVVIFPLLAIGGERNR